MSYLRCLNGHGLVMAIGFAGCLTGMSRLAYAQALSPLENATPMSLQPTVVEVEFEGLRRVSVSAIEDRLKTKKGEPLDIDNLSADLRSLWETEYFEDITIGTRSTPEGLVVVIQVKEKPAIRKIVFRGRDGISEEDIKGVVDVKTHTILNTELLKRNVEKIRNLYLDKGYFLVEVDFKVENISEKTDDVRVIFNIVENTKVVVRDVAFVGNLHIPSEDLRGVIQTRVGNELSFMSQSGTYKEEFFQTDLLRIQAYYWDHGYVDVKVEPGAVTLSKDRRFIYVVIKVSEGERYRIGSTRFSGQVEVAANESTGQLGVDEERLRKLLSLENGDLFNRTKLFETIQGFTRAYKDQGYAYANITPNSALRKEKRLVDLEFSVELGKLVHIGRIEVSGNTRTRDKVIRREMRIYEGDTFSQSGIELSRARIFQLGYFETVDITTARADDSDWLNVTVAVKEKSTGTFQVGAGFSTTESFIATAQISQDNFLGNGQLVQLQLQLSFGRFARQLANVQFQEPYLFGSRFGFGLNGYIRQQIFTAFEAKTQGASPTIIYPLTHELRLHLGYTLEYVDIGSQLDQSLGRGSAVAGLARSGMTSSINTSLSYDSRDNRLFPTKGMNHLLSGTISNSALGSTELFEFWRATAALRFYHPLPFGLVAKLNLEMGMVGGGGESGVPINERFFPGGIYTVRGFAFQGLGPSIQTLTNGDPLSPSRNFVVGGNKQVVINFEIEIPVMGGAGIKGVLFADAGNGYNDNEGMFYLGTPKADRPIGYAAGSGKPIDLPLGMFYSVGFGVRWLSPIGPLRFEWGIPLTKVRPSDRPIQFEFTIGNAF